MLQWHCKNIGLYRGKGKFLVVTNADDIFSPHLFDVLASARRLRTDSFYRAQSVSVSLTSPGSALYNLSENHAQKWSVADGVLASGTAQKLCVNSSLLESRLTSRFSDFWDDYDAAYGVRLNDSAHDLSGIRHPWNLYMDMPGDFVLASREAWAEVRGAPLVLQNHNVDLLLICRFASRFRQVVLATPCFYATQEHPTDLHDQFRNLAWRLREAADDFVSATSRLSAAQARLLERGQTRTFLKEEIERLQEQVRKAGSLKAKLRREHELRIDNVFDRCRAPFIPFASEMRYTGSEDWRDWGFAKMAFPETVVQP